MTTVPHSTVSPLQTEPVRGIVFSALEAIEAGQPELAGRLARWGAEIVAWDKAVQNGTPTATVQGIEAGRATP